MRFGLVGAFFLLLTPGLLAAQDARQVAEFQAVNAREAAPETATIAAEAKALLAIMVKAGQLTCTPTAAAIDSIAPATATRLVIDGINAGKLLNGWTANAKLEGCPEAPVTRLIVLRMTDASLLVRIINRGETLTTASQMRDSSAGAAMAAVAAIRKTVPGCEGDGMAMGATRVAAQDSNLGPDVFGSRFAGSWSEVWRFSACGVEADVPIGFKADGSGGVFSDIRGAETRIVAP